MIAGQKYKSDKGSQDRQGNDPSAAVRLVVEFKLPWSASRETILQDQPIIDSSKYKSIVVLTGAGISKASGLPTFRGEGGIWGDTETAKLSSADTLIAEPELYWKLWGKLKDSASQAAPNAGHFALAQWEASLKMEQKYLLITQNVDNLHQRAGSKNVAELHGSLYRTRCTNSKCKSTPLNDIESHAEMIPHCQRCGSVLRPDIVLFDEPLPLDAEYQTKKALRDCDLFIAVGTSGNVSPASRFVEWAKYAQAKTVLVNQDVLDAPKSFDLIIGGLSEEVLPVVLQ